MTDRLEQRYAGAASSGNLSTRSVNGASDAEILGAAAFGGKRGQFALLLVRMFAGDAAAAREAAAELTRKATGKAWHEGHRKLRRVQAEEMARTVLSWHLDGACKACNGHGTLMIAGTTTLGSTQCPACAGAGRRNFDGLFPAEYLELARWLMVDVEREQARAASIIRRGLGV